jgi:hypothetical protein
MVPLLDRAWPLTHVALLIHFLTAFDLSRHCRESHSTYREPSQTLIFNQRPELAMKVLKS